MAIQVTTRTGKGAELTQTEMDNNLTNLARSATTTQEGNTRLATTAEATAGTATNIAVTPAGAAAAYAETRTWQDVKASRSTGTIYTNGTNKTIQVCVHGRTGDFYGTVELYVSEVLLSQFANQFGDRPLNATVVADIPPGVSYRVETPTVIQWYELR